MGRQREKIEKHELQNIFYQLQSIALASSSKLPTW